MNVQIIETGARFTLSVIDPQTHVDWSQDLIGNAGAIGPGLRQFTWSADADAYLTDQATYDWWANYIDGQQQTNADIQALADATGLSYTDIAWRIEHGYDYDLHRVEAVAALDRIRAEYGLTKDGE